MVFLSPHEKKGIDIGYLLDVEHLFNHHEKDALSKGSRSQKISAINTVSRSRRLASSSSFYASGEEVSWPSGPQDPFVFPVPATTLEAGPPLLSWLPLTMFKRMPGLFLPSGAAPPLAVYIGNRIKLAFRFEMHYAWSIKFGIANQSAPAVYEAQD